MPSWSEILGFITGVLCVALGAKEIVWAWPIGLVNNAVYLVLFWRNGLYAIALLQLVYAAISIYGWWNWLHGGKKRDDSSQPEGAQIQRASFTGRLAVFGATVALFAAIYYVLLRYTNSDVPGWDALTTAMSISAQFMLSRKWIETWAVWIVVDCIYIALALQKQMYVTSLLYLIFMALCTAAWVGWSRQLRKVAAVAQV